MEPRKKDGTWDDRLVHFDVLDLTAPLWMYPVEKVRPALDAHPIDDVPPHARLAAWRMAHRIRGSLSIGLRTSLARVIGKVEAGVDQLIDDIRAKAGGAGRKFRMLVEIDKALARSEGNGSDEVWLVGVSADTAPVERELRWRFSGDHPVVAEIAALLGERTDPGSSIPHVLLRIGKVPVPFRVETIERNSEGDLVAVIVTATVSTGRRTGTKLRLKRPSGETIELRVKRGTGIVDASR